jgi:hypothetical protein
MEFQRSYPGHYTEHEAALILWLLDPGIDSMQEYCAYCIW